MSVAAKWKLKEKEAAAAAAAAAAGTAAAKTDDSGFRGRGKIDTPARETSSAADSLGKDSEKSNKLDMSKPAPNAAGNAVGKQGFYKLPVGKDAAKTPHTKEPNCVLQGNDSRSQQPVNSGPSKTTPNGGKEMGSNYGGSGRRAFGAGLKKEEPAVTTKAKTDVKVIESKIVTDKDAMKDGGDDKESPFGSGRTKGLAGFWANQTDEVKSVKKKRLTAIEDNLDATIVENSPPQQREGVARAEDPGEWKKPIQLQEGWTKNVANSLQTQRQNAVVAKKTPICLIEETIDEKTDLQDASTKAVVRVKEISQRLVGQQIEPQKPKEKVVIDRSQGPIVLAENQPDEVDPDVVRSESASEEVVLEKGRTRNLLQHWKNTEVEYNAPKTSTTRYQGTKPAWILEIEAAKGNTGNKTEDTVDEEEKESTLAKDEEIYKTDPRLEHVNETAEDRKTESSKTTATQGAERDNIKTPSDEDAGEKEPSKSAVEPSDRKPHSPTLSGKPGSDKEHIVATVTVEAEPTSTVAETQRTTMSVSETSPVCHEPNPILTSDSKKRIEPENDRLDRIKVDEEPETAKIIDTKSAREDVPAVISSDEPNVSVGMSPGVLENAFSEKDIRESAAIPNERPILECESRDSFAVNEDKANWHLPTTHLQQNVTELPITAAAQVHDNAEQSIDARINDEITAKEEPQSKVEEAVSSVTQSPVDKDQIKCYNDNFSRNPDWKANEELKQTDASDLNELGQSKAIIVVGDRVVDELSSEPRSEILKISTDRPAPDDLVPEPDTFSTPTSDFNLLTFDSPLDSTPSTLGQPDDGQKTETNIFSTLDDILKTDFSSFLLDENVDNTPCLLPSGPAEIPRSTENQENSSYRQEHNLENDASIGSIIDETSESFVSEASDDKRAGKREEEEELTKTENSQRSCSVM